MLEWREWILKSSGCKDAKERASAMDGCDYRRYVPVIWSPAIPAGMTNSGRTTYAATNISTAII